MHRVGFPSFSSSEVGRSWLRNGFPFSVLVIIILVLRVALLCGKGEGRQIAATVLRKWLA